MITQMNRYSIVLLSSDLGSFLKDLQGLGLVDITRSRKAVDASSREMMERSSRYRSVIKMVRALPKTAEKTSGEDRIPAERLLSTLEEGFRREKEIKALISAKSREMEEAALWGDYRQEDLVRIQSMGYRLHFYSTAEKKFDAGWPQEYPLQILNRSNGRIYFTVLSPAGEAFSFPLQESKFPEIPLSTLRLEYGSLEKEQQTLHGLISTFPRYLQELETQKAVLDNRYEYYLAEASTCYEGEDSIAVLEGFAPVSDRDKISAFLDESEACYLVTEARAEDNPPVKLKNNGFTRAFETIGDFYMLPRYDELDLTPYFAPFYMLFFGFCLGDMGYGLILLILGLTVTFAVPRFKKYGILVTYLGIGTLIMPALTGTFFGTKIYELIDLPEAVDRFFFSDMKLFWFGILFGLFHIVFAKVLRGIYCFTRKKIDEGIDSIGWALLIIWATQAYAGMEMDRTFLPATVSGILLYGSLLMIVFCSKPTRHFLLRPVLGITSLYDITGVFGDMLSYIRLFGLATSGGILGMVVNSVAGQLSSLPYVGAFFGLLMLLVGHIAVMALSSLGAFVHPMRLTFVEFYKNAKFTGGGRAFRPLKRTTNNNNN